MSKVGVFFATGFEEIEALTVVDLLRRAGIETSCISIENKEIATGSHQISVMMNEKLEDVDFDSLDMIVCPGGLPGTTNLEACEALTTQIRRFYETDKLIAAICAAPSIFGHMGILEGKKACIYPGMEKELYGAEVCYDEVVRVDNVITSRGMGTAIPFGLKLVEAFLGETAAKELGQKIVFLK